MGGYDVITIEAPQFSAGIWTRIYQLKLGQDYPRRLPPKIRPLPTKMRMLQPRSKRTRSFDLFKVSSSAFLEFAQTPLTENGIKDFADRYGPLEADPDPRPRRGRPWSGNLVALGRSIDAWRMLIRKMHRTVELWEKSKITGDFSRIICVVERLRLSLVREAPGAPITLLLKKDPLSSSARLCIRPHSLVQALWAQLVLAIDGNLNLGACVQCHKWFTLEAGRGRSDKAYCSNACRMRAYRKRKSSRPGED